MKLLVDVEKPLEALLASRWYVAKLRLREDSTPIGMPMKISAEWAWVADRASAHRFDEVDAAAMYVMLHDEDAELLGNLEIEDVGIE